MLVTGIAENVCWAGFRHVERERALAYHVVPYQAVCAVVDFPHRCEMQSGLMDARKSVLFQQFLVEPSAQMHCHLLSVQGPRDKN